ncbi:J domain-containing protein [Sphingomicrobium lutaoense]|uniref:DnaJ-class molecular chaperone n=1 Tax=Sphingomicrobium lutaoense TaxID=515949 RepID=A0A839Z0I8_9SPHN|nr:DnaJ domain-containing protein [Sphingomicrobium lutaoense]MBB3763567.1 DnaJ-class molecular chaperone [Sphingomicrobium lutaoense]
MDTNLYALLGLSPGASRVEIKRAYHAQMRRFHPDSGDERADGDHAGRLNEAYGILSDPGRRAAYDRMLKARIEQAGGHLPARRSAAKSPRPVRVARPVYLNPIAIFWLLFLTLLLFSPFLYAVWWSLP